MRFLFLLLLPSLLHAQVYVKGKAYVTGRGMVGTIGATGGGGGFTPNAVTLDGSSQFNQRSDVLAGAAASKVFTFSVWVNKTADSTREIFYSANGSVEIGSPFGGAIHVVAKNASGTTILDATSTATISQSAWHNILFSCDLSNVGNRHLVIDNTEDASVTWTTYSNDSIKWTEGSAGNPSWAVGAFHSGGNYFPGCLMEVYINCVTYIDFSVSGNRLKFNDGGSPLRPISLGTDGSTPTGSQPIIYLKGPAATWGSNSGSGGDFTIQNGPLSSCTAP